MVEGSRIVQKFLGKEIHLTPGALSLLRGQSDPLSAVEEVLADFRDMSNPPPVVTKKILSHILKSEESILSGEAGEPSTVAQDRSKSEEFSDISAASGLKEASGQEVATQGPPEHELPSEKLEERVRVLQDVTGQTAGGGDIEDFVALFQDRYERLSKIIKLRENFRDSVSMGDLNKYEGRDVGIIGLVVDKRDTRKGDAKLLRIEDLKGRATIYVKDVKRNESLIKKIEGTVTDEVIGAEIKVPEPFRDDGRGPLVWGNDIVWPDIPISSSESSESSKESQVEEPINAVLLSDFHVGSKMFLEETFRKFLGWLRGESGSEDQRKLASQVRYILIAGDLVDGVGIYPRQQRELSISDVYEQYEALADLLEEVPNYVEIIAAPGNHDAVRLAEPQPALPPEVASSFDGLNIQFVGNPASISIHGVNFLIYHGCGFDDLISADSELDYVNPVKPMVKALQKRHLAPIYGKPMGGRTPIAPEEKDYLVIEEPPDVLHCGHIHRHGAGKYRGVLLINSATFQERTSYMKSRGIVPTPGVVPVVNLQTMKVRTIHFD